MQRTDLLSGDEVLPSKLLFAEMRLKWAAGRWGRLGVGGEGPGVLASACKGFRGPPSSTSVHLSPQVCHGAEKSPHVTSLLGARPAVLLPVTQATPLCAAGPKAGVKGLRKALPHEQLSDAAKALSVGWDSDLNPSLALSVEETAQCSKQNKTLTGGQETWPRGPALSQTCCVTLSKPLALSGCRMD